MNNPFGALQGYGPKRYQTRTSLFRTALTGSVSSILIPNIPQTYDHLEIYMESVTDASSSSAASNIIIQFNGDTNSSNYAYLQSYYVNAGGHANNGGGYYGGYTATHYTTDANTMGSVVTTILGYTDSWYKMTWGWAWVPLIATAGTNYLIARNMLWVNTNPITQIYISTDTGNLTNPTTCELFGIKTEVLSMANQP